MAWPTSPVDGEIYENRVWSASIGAWLDNVMTAGKTITIAAGTTATEMNELIEAQPRDLNSYTLTIQFEDDIYVTDTALSFVGFHSGKVRIAGNSADNTLSGSKSVEFNPTNDSNCMVFTNCSAHMEVVYIEIDHNNLSTTTNNVITVNNCSRVEFEYCALEGKTGFGEIIQASHNSYVYTTYTAYANGYRALSITTSAHAYVSATCTFASVTNYFLYVSGGFISYTGNVATDAVTHYSINGGLIIDDTGIV